MSKKLSSLFKLIRYSQGIFSFEKNEWNPFKDQLISWSNWRSSACVLARKHYTEYQREYAITNLYHLYKVIKAEADCIAPFDGQVFWAITRFELKNWQVTYWAVPQDVIDQLVKQFKFVIPESLIFMSSVSDESLTQFGEGSESLFVYKSKQGFCSLVADTMVSSLERFAAMVNRFDLLPDTCVYTQSQSDAILARYMASLPLRVLPGLMLSSGKTIRSIDWSQYRIPTAMFAVPLVVYAGFFSWYLTEQNDLLDISLQEKRTEMSQLLTREKQANEATQILLDYRQLELENPGLNRIITLIDSILPEHAVINGLELIGRNVTIRGVTPSATQIFRLLSEHPRTDSVEFAGAIAEDRVTKMERFVIKFEFQFEQSEVGNE